jgi:hypothetical protein
VGSVALNILTWDASPPVLPGPSRSEFCPYSPECVE